VKAVIYAKLQDSTSLQIVPSFAARISGGFAYLEAPGDESGNYLNLAQAAESHIHNLS